MLEELRVKYKSGPTGAKWVTTEMAEKMDRQFYLTTTTRDTIFFGIYLANITFVAFGMMYPSMYFLTQAMKEQFTETNFKSEYNNITFEEIKSVSDFWKYADMVFIPKLYSEHWYDEVDPIKVTKPGDKNILFENKLITLPVIRQVKVKNDSCEIQPEFRRLFLECFNSYNSKTMDTDKFGVENGSAWTYNDPQDVKTCSHYGKVGTYDGGGFYQILADSPEKTRTMLLALHHNLWITRGTRSIFLDFTVYNPNVNLFCVCQIVFEFPPTGGIIPSAYFYPTKLLRYVSFTDFAILGCEFILIGYIIYYAAEEVREMVYFKGYYLKHFWTYIDQLIILTSFVYFVITIIKYVKVTSILKDISKNPDQYISLKQLANFEEGVRNTLAIVLFLSYIKIFKYMNFNKTMGQMKNTLKKCVPAIFGFSGMCVLIFVSFALAGYLLFGTQLKEFSGFWRSMFTLLRTTKQGFNYSKAEQAHCVIAPVYYFLFISLIFFVVLNMFLAIIFDSYAATKTEFSRKPVGVHLLEFWKYGYFHLMLKYRCAICMQKSKTVKHALTNKEIREALKNCGFNNNEIESFFTRHNIDPNGPIDNYNVLKLEEDILAITAETLEAKPIVTFEALDEMKAYQKKLDKVEITLGKIVNRLDAIVEKLNTLEKARNEE